MLSSPVYAESHPRLPVPHPRRASISFCFSQPSNLSTCKDANNVQAPSEFPHPNPLLSRQQTAPANPLAATPTDHPASVANKRLTKNVTPLDATLTKNKGWGVSIFFRPSHQIPVTALFSITYKLPIFYPLCFEIHPCNGGCTPLPAFLPHAFPHLQSLYHSTP